MKGRCVYSTKRVLYATALSTCLLVLGLAEAEALSSMGKFT